MAETYYPGGVDPNSYGYLSQGFQKPFDYPEMPLSAVASPFNERFSFGAQDLARDPGVDYRFNKGLEATNRLLFAQGKGYGGAALKGLTEYGQGEASQEWGNAYNRAMQEYLTRFNIQGANQDRLANRYNEAYGRAAGRYGTEFDVFNSNQNNLFNRLQAIQSGGQTAGNTLGSLGANYAGNASNTMQNNATSLADIWGGGANAGAAGVIGSNNAWNNAFGSISKNLADIWANQQYGVA